MDKKTRIQVFGSNCPTCKKLFEQTKQAVAELKLDVAVEYFDDIQKAVALGAMSSPVLVIDNKIALAGQVPGVKKIKEIIAKGTTEPEPASGCSCGCC